MNAKQIKRALTRQDRGYKVVADLYEGDQWANKHLLMGKAASFRRMKKAAMVLMKTNQFSIQFRYGGQIINSKTTNSLVEGWNKTAPADRARNHWWPAMVSFYIKMNRLSERLNAQYAPSAVDVMAADE